MSCELSKYHGKDSHNVAGYRAAAIEDTQNTENLVDDKPLKQLLCLHHYQCRFHVPGRSHAIGGYLCRVVTYIDSTGI